MDTTGTSKEAGEFQARNKRKVNKGVMEVMLPFEHI